MTDHKYQCPHCAQHLEIPDDLLGQTLECPSCKGQFSISKPTPVAVRVATPPSPPPTPLSHPDGACPLCGQTKHMHKAKELYGHMVCKKCYYAFANRRHFAFFLDAIGWRILMFPIGFMIGIAMVTGGSSQSEIESAARVIDWLILPIFFCKDCFSGHSLGKLIMGVRVIDETTGEPAGIGASFKRNLPLIIPFWPLIVAFQLCKGHRDGDGWSNSKVIWKKYANHPIFLCIACKKGKSEPLKPVKVEPPVEQPKPVKQGKEHSGGIGWWGMALVILVVLVLFIVWICDQINSSTNNAGGSAQPEPQKQAQPAPQPPAPQKNVYDYRIWTSKTGKQIEAKFISYEESNNPFAPLRINVETRDGTIYRFYREDLSEDDKKLF